MTNPQPSSFSLKSIIENPKLKVGLCKLFFCEYRYTVFFKISVIIQLMDSMGKLVCHSSQQAWAFKMLVVHR